MEPTWGRQLLLVSGYQSFFPLLSDSLFYLIFHLSPRTLYLTPLLEIPTVMSVLLILLMSVLLILLISETQA